MKNFRDYLSESEEAATNPVAGDTFAINIREECLIESVIVESRSDGVVIAADDRMMQLLESYGYTFEQTCMECGGSGCGCGQAPEEYGDETDAGQNPGEYDQEGDMAKDELLTVIRSARKLIGMLDNDDNMPEWTQKKITKSADYVDTASDYISSQKERGVMEQSEDSNLQDLIKKHRELMRSYNYELRMNDNTHFPYMDEMRDRLKEMWKLIQAKKAADQQSVTEQSQENNPVARATLHRIMMRHPGMLAQHGPERVMKAVDDVADLVGDMDDIGTSDVSGWVNMVQEILDSLDQGVAEDLQADDGERYRSADDFFGQFEADYFDEEQVSPDGMEVRGYIDGVNVMVWRFDSPRKTSGYGIYDDSELNEAEYQGRKVPLGKPMQGDVAKSKVYVKDPKTGNVKKVNFGDPNMKIKKSNPARRKSFRARHNCDNPGPRTKARYWSCRAW